MSERSAWGLDHSTGHHVNDAEKHRLAEIHRRVKAVNDHGEPCLKEFIVHAGEDVIWLLDYVVQLRRERDEWKRRMRAVHDGIQDGTIEHWIRNVRMGRSNTGFPAPEGEDDADRRD